MKTIDIALRLVSLGINLTAAIIERVRPKSPPPSAAVLDALERHCWSSDGPNDPPVYCYFCKQLREVATSKCPGSTR